MKRVRDGAQDAHPAGDGLTVLYADDSRKRPVSLLKQAM